MSFAKILKKYRTEAKYTQKYIANQLGCMQSYVSKWENSPRIIPDIKYVNKLANLFGPNFRQEVAELRSSRDINKFSIGAGLAYSRKLPSDTTGTDASSIGTFAYHLKHMHNASTRTLVNNIFYWITEATKDPRSTASFTGEFLLNAAPFCYWSNSCIEGGKKEAQDVYNNLTDNGFSVDIHGNSFPYTWVISWKDL